MKNIGLYLGLALAVILLIILLVIISIEEDGQKFEIVADVSIPIQLEKERKIEFESVFEQEVNEPELEPAKDYPIFMGEPGDHPHPMTKKHLNLFKENENVAEIFGALDIQDLEKLRELRTKYRLDSSDKYVLQNGLDLIINCMTNKTASAIYSAQSYYDTEKASRLRRHVRRFCLE